MKFEHEYVGKSICLESWKKLKMGKDRTSEYKLYCIASHASIQKVWRLTVTALLSQKPTFHEIVYELLNKVLFEKQNYKFW